MARTTAARAGRAGTPSGVSRGLPAPLYHQVAEDLRQKIAQGVWPPETQLPNEAELCELYKVSRITLRHAIALLVGDGLVVRTQGSGTFVRNTTLTEGLRGLSSFSEEMRALGVRAGGRVLHQGVVPASREQAAALQVPEHGKLFELRRLRTADGTPIGLQTSYLPLDRFPDLDRHDFEDRSLYHVLESEYGVRLFEAFETLRMGPVGAADARLLQLRPGSSAFLVERCTFDAQGPFELVSSLMRGDRYQIRMRLARG